MGKLVVSTIETQNINYDSDTPSIIINSSGNVHTPGSVVQHVEMIPLGERGITAYPTTTSQTFVNSGIYVDITPKYSNSIFVVRASIQAYNNGTYGGITIYRGDSVTWNQLNLDDPDGAFTGSTNPDSRGLGFWHNATHYNVVSVFAKDAPGVISTVRYTIGFLSWSSSNVSYLGWNGSQAGTYKNAMNMDVMEIAQ